MARFFTAEGPPCGPGPRSWFPLASKVGLLAGDALHEVTATAGELVQGGHGDRLIQLPGWWSVLTAHSFLDYCNELPDALALALSIASPTLYIRGDLEPAELYPAEEFAARSSGPCDVRILENCDHFYVGREEAIADIVSDWLQTTLTGSGESSA